MVAMNRFDDVLLLYDSDNEPVEGLVGGGKSESDDEDFQEGAVVCFAAAFTALSVREMFYARQRLIWSKHVQRSRDYVDEKNRGGSYIGRSGVTLHAARRIRNIGLLRA
ncbi:hypothetical protein PR001_g18998 [Phytophthora rubi]|uniref:Uncharacterized protein n=1 Tax=Phytophthora rubi TaxID=129364 RepID=A0A6A3K5W5_9STRA|nr:hypothetical protein PR002_g22312 [Phytophthora rubi]KAE8999654.1 hypothetical protein PR001_g18998 [Phytophthora rubi]